MKARILLGAVLWIVLVTVAHVLANIGPAEFATDVREFLGMERRSLRVGFLPVT